LLQSDTYYADGQIKDEVYEFGSFIQSKMYHKGIRCSDCHDPHSLQLKHQGNETCTSCHQHPAGKYDVPSHHHHAVGSEAALCVSCHMPGRTYMDVDFRRDHSLRVPRPDLSVQWGTPNACSACHVNDLLDQVPVEQRDSLPEYAHWLDAAEAGDDRLKELIRQTDQWCDQACQTWYGPNRERPHHYGEAIASFRAGDPAGVDQMLALSLRRDDLTPDIARATALDNLASQGISQAAKVGAEVLADPAEHPLVRAAAVRTLAALSASAAKRALMPHLKDPSRLVRNEVTQLLSTPGLYHSLTASERTQVDLALRDVESTLMITADRAGAHMAWAAICEQRGKIFEAIAAYETAIRVEPNMAGPRTNLAALLDQVAEQGDSRAVARAKQLRSDELPLLARDAKLAPDNAVVQYRYGLALYLSGNDSQALEQLERTGELAPDVDDYQLALRLLREKLQSPNP
jgi:tetratricopeptide (TPR) repeat protein